jgi:hypothetical protein
VARRLKRYDFGDRYRNNGRVGHPWNDWLDGSPWRLRRGDDFDASVKNFQAHAARAANARGLSIRTARESDEVVVIQAVDRG